MYFYVLLLLNRISYAIFGWHVSFFYPNVDFGDNYCRYC